MSCVPNVVLKLPGKEKNHICFGLPSKSPSTHGRYGAHAVYKQAAQSWQVQGKITDSWVDTKTSPG